MIKVKRVSITFIDTYAFDVFGITNVGKGMYIWRTTLDGKLIDETIYWGDNAGIKTLLHEFIHYLQRVFKIPKPIDDILDIIMHLKWWMEKRK